MKNFFKLLLIFSIIYLNLSCSKNNETIISDDPISPENLYKLAMADLKEENFAAASLKFDEITFKHPLSSEAIQSQIMSAFIDYVNLNYNEAIFKFNKIINRYPSYKSIDYAYYMKAMCYYEQIENVYLDGQNNELALENFIQVVNRFPLSEYKKDSEQKILLIKQNIAAKHMHIAKFYLEQKKYLAAMKRYQKVVEEHQQSKFTPEALHRLVEIYYSLGMIEEAKKNASVLGYNYPKSKWYEYSFKLVGPKDEKDKDNSFFKKFSKFLNKDDEER